MAQNINAKLKGMVIKECLCRTYKYGAQMYKYLLLLTMAEAIDTGCRWQVTSEVTSQPPMTSDTERVTPINRQ